MDAALIAGSCVASRRRGCRTNDRAGGETKGKAKNEDEWRE